MAVTWCYEKLHIFRVPSLLPRLMFESFKQATMAIVCKDICREELVSLLEKGISPGWWDKEIHKITYNIVSELIEFSSEVKDTQEIVLKELYLLYIIGYCWKKKTKIFNIKKRVDGFLKNKTNNPFQIYETFYNCKPCDILEISEMKLI